MDNQTILDYVLNSPENTNPVILNQMLNELKGGSTQMLKFVKDSYSATIVVNQETGEAHWDINTLIEDFSQYDFVTIQACSAYYNIDSGGNDAFFTGTYLMESDQLSCFILGNQIHDDGTGSYSFYPGTIRFNNDNKQISCEAFEEIYMQDNDGFEIKLEFCKYILE